MVVREFDLRDRVFVEGGFMLPEAKSEVGWIDADHIYVATDFGPGTLTASGYPHIVKRWRRGTPLSAAELVYEGRFEDISVGATHDPTLGYERDLVDRYLDFYRSEQYLRTPTGDLVRIDVPDDAACGVHRDWPAATGFDHTSIVDTDPDNNDAYLIATTGFSNRPPLASGPSAARWTYSSGSRRSSTRTAWWCASSSPSPPTGGHGTAADNEQAATLSALTLEFLWRKTLCR